MYRFTIDIKSPCAYAQGIIPATPGYTALGQLSAKLPHPRLWLPASPYLLHPCSRAHAPCLFPIGKAATDLENVFEKMFQTFTTSSFHGVVQTFSTSSFGFGILLRSTAYFRIGVPGVVSRGSHDTVRASRLSPCLRTGFCSAIKRQIYCKLITPK